MEAKQIFRIILFWVLGAIGLGSILYGLVGLFNYDIIRELLFVLWGLSAWATAGNIKIKDE